MAPRLLYLIFCQLLRWLGLLVRRSATNKRGAAGVAARGRGAPAPGAPTPVFLAGLRRDQVITKSTRTLVELRARVLQLIRGGTGNRRTARSAAMTATSRRRGRHRAASRGACRPNDRSGIDGEPAIWHCAAM